LRLHEARRDLYRRLAKEQGFKSRAAFKLIEVVERFRFIKEGDKVVDFGAAPGGWLQVCSTIVGDSGIVIGLDIDPILVKDSHVKKLQSDVYDESVPDQLRSLLGGMADVFLSDIAPAVSGTWDLDHYRQVEMTMRVLSLAEVLLKNGGNAFFKVFEGERSQDLRREVARRFVDVKLVKPRASRSVSSELYYLCLGWRGVAGTPGSFERLRTSSETTA